jgi:TonB family protein
MKKLPIAAILAACFLLFLVPDSFSQSYTPARTFGEDNLVQDFLCSEVTYPPEALKNGTEGTVILEFQVTTQGEVENLHIKQPVSPDIDAEAERLFRMLLWQPAEKMGIPVKSTQQFSIKFDIKKYQKHCKSRGYEQTTYPFTPVDTSYIVYETTQVDKPPHAVFEEKNMTLGRFISMNIKYPETAYKQNIFGKVILRFVVEPQGRVSNIKVVEPVSGGCTQEAIRLLGLVHWMPGIKDSMAVRTIMNMEIDFKLPEDSDTRMFDSQMNSN